MDGAVVTAGVGAKFRERPIPPYLIFQGEATIPLSVSKLYIWGLRLPLLLRKRFLREWLHPLSAGKSYMNHLTLMGRLHQYRSDSLPLHQPKIFRGQLATPIRVGKHHTLRELRAQLPMIRRILRALLADSA